MQVRLPGTSPSSSYTTKDGKGRVKGGSKGGGRGRGSGKGSRKGSGKGSGKGSRKGSGKGGRSTSPRWGGKGEGGRAASPRLENNSPRSSPVPPEDFSLLTQREIQSKFTGCTERTASLVGKWSAPRSKGFIHVTSEQPSGHMLDGAARIAGRFSSYFVWCSTWDYRYQMHINQDGSIEFRGWIAKENVSDSSKAILELNFKKAGSEKELRWTKVLLPLSLLKQTMIVDKSSALDADLRRLVETSDEAWELFQEMQREKKDCQDKEMQQEKFYKKYLSDNTKCAIRAGGFAAKAKKIQPVLDAANKELTGLNAQRGALLTQTLGAQNALSFAREALAKQVSARDALIEQVNTFSYDDYIL